MENPVRRWRNFCKLRIPVTCPQPDQEPSWDQTSRLVMMRSSETGSLAGVTPFIKSAKNFSAGHGRLHHHIPGKARARTRHMPLLERGLGLRGEPRLLLSRNVGPFSAYMDHMVHPPPQKKCRSLSSFYSLDFVTGPSRRKFSWIQALFANHLANLPN